MNSIPAQEIERRGISALDSLLKDGPVQVIKHNRPEYVVLSTEAYQRLTAGSSAWEWLDRPVTGRRDKAQIDKALERQRSEWGVI